MPWFIADFSSSKKMSNINTESMIPTNYSTLIQKYQNKGFLVIGLNLDCPEVKMRIYSDVNDTFSIEFSNPAFTKIYEANHFSQHWLEYLHQYGFTVVYHKESYPLQDHDFITKRGKKHPLLYEFIRVNDNIKLKFQEEASLKEALKIFKDDNVKILHAKFPDNLESLRQVFEKQSQQLGFTLTEQLPQVNPTTEKHRVSTLFVESQNKLIPDTAEIKASQPAEHSRNKTSCVIS